MKKLNRKLSVATLAIAVTATASLMAQEREENLSESTVAFLSAFNQAEIASEDLSDQEEIKNLSFDALSSEEADSDEDSIEEARNLKAEKEADEKATKLKAEKEAAENEKKASNASIDSTWSGRLQSFFAPVINLFTKFLSIFA